HRNAIHGLATSYVHLKNYHQAEKHYRLQFELETKADDQHNAVIAQHNIGVMQLYLKQYAEARKTLKQSEALAIMIDDSEWMYYSARHQAFSFRDEGDIAKGTTFLSDKIAHYRCAKQHVVAAWLAEDLTHLWLTVQDADSQVLESHRLQVECWQAAKGMHLELWNSQSLLFAWLWDRGHFDEAMASLRELTKLAEKHGMQEQLCRCWDQYGTNLQQLNRFEEAEKYHKKGLKLARRLKNVELLKNAFNNLGELYHKTGELKKAERLLNECELIAVQTEDMETRISSAHNRALVVRDLGRRKESKKLLERSMKLAKQHSIWDEYVRAILGLANHAYQDGETRTAVNLYRQTIQAAGKYEDNERLWQARLNLAGLYRNNGKPEKAIEQLELAVPYFAVVADGVVHFGYLAECYEETKNFSKAEKYWTLSLEMATKVGAAEGQLFARVALAKTAGRLRGFAAGQAAFEQLLKSVQPKEKARVCRGAVELAIECKELAVACKWANKIGKVAVAGQDSADLVDTYMLFADALWEHAEHRNAAAEFCILGQINAYSVSLEAGSNACMHLLWKLMQLS
ncbi:MAG TPA: tetratricopeptide repeat protein, partial [Gemmatales bacterium]|nr:tetratricopeptide repeat protein [Gemmatales bacterium]